MSAEAGARVLHDARVGHVLLDAMPDELAPDSPDAAYEIQAAWAGLAGWDVAGWKIGCTSAAAQEMLGTDGPFAGRVFAPYRFDSPATVPADHVPGARMEGEFAFVLGTDLPDRGSPHDRASVAAAVAEARPAIEIVATRFSDFTGIGVLNLIADCGANGGLVLGDAVPGWADIDLAATEVVMRIDGEEVGRGTGAEVMGHPLDALAWLADELVRQGLHLRAGDVVSTGTCTGAVPLPPGSTADADHGPMGTVGFTTTR